MNLNRRHVLSLSLLLAGCGGGGGGADPQPAAAPAPAPAPAPVQATPEPFVSKHMHKLGPFSSDVEAAVVAWNGEVLVISFLRDWRVFDQPGATSLRVRRWADGVVLAEHPWPACMGCVVVHNGELHIFGATHIGAPGNRIVHSVLDPVSFAPSAPVDALLNSQAAPFRFYNTEVCADADGFCMVVETTAGIWFARSRDLVTWERTGGQFNAGNYVGCPTLDYVDGAHHLTWLANEGERRYVTKTARSTDDCLTFTYGKTIFAPAADEGTNNSDVAFEEFGGKVFGVYIDGDQSTWGSQKRFRYDGTLAQMFAKYA